MITLNFDGGSAASSAPLLRRGINFGPVEITGTDDNDTPTALAGWKAYAQVRRVSDGPLILDLAPVIEADDADGLITLPEVLPDASRLLTAGSYVWDLVLEDPDGRLLEPVLGGKFVISSTVTQISKP